MAQNRQFFPCWKATAEYDIVSEWLINPNNYMRGAAYPASCDKLLFRDKFDKLSVNRKGDENLPVYQTSSSYKVMQSCLWKTLFRYGTVTHNKENTEKETNKTSYVINSTKLK